jgi:hypothetical protein
MRPGVQLAVLHDQAARVLPACGRGGSFRAGGIVVGLFAADRECHTREQVFHVWNDVMDGVLSLLRRHLGQQMFYAFHGAGSPIEFGTYQIDSGATHELPADNRPQHRDEHYGNEGDKQVGNDEPIAQAPDHAPGVAPRQLDHKQHASEIENDRG